MAWVCCIEVAKSPGLQPASRRTVGPDPCSGHEGAGFSFHLPGIGLIQSPAAQGNLEAAFNIAPGGFAHGASILNWVETQRSPSPVQQGKLGSASCPETAPSILELQLGSGGVPSTCCWLSHGGAVEAEGRNLLGSNCPPAACMQLLLPSTGAEHARLRGLQ